MGRKNRRKKSAYARKMKGNPKRLITKKQETVHSSAENQAAQPEFSTPQRGDIWFVELGEHPGTSVQEGCRPAFILSNNLANIHSDTLTVVPLTSKMKKVYLPTHVVVSPSDCLKLEPSMALAEQVTTIGKSALKSCVGQVGEEKMHEIERAIGVHLGLT